MRQSMMDALLARMSEDDIAQLKRIYEPTVVASPPGDACRNLCVAPDGEIRIYGSKETSYTDFCDPGIEVYAASRDGGLSWKTHTIDKVLAIGAAAINPKTGRYLTTYPNEYRPAFNKAFGKEGTWAVFNDEGFDSDNNRYVKISDRHIHILKLPMYLESVDMWLVVGQTDYEGFETHITVSRSFDDGESWTTEVLEHTAPLFEVHPPHGMIRWQQQSCEPTVVELSDGTLLMYLRTSQDYHYCHISKDHGASWSEIPVPSPFHGTITMPVLYRLHDGRILFFWCNTQPLPELSPEDITPPLWDWELKGYGEDVFTNRDANHLAISEDDGRTWIGLREMFLNPLRNAADFRRCPPGKNGDKSVHQGQIIELPYHKILVHFGQNAACRTVAILDLDWLYEKEREEDFLLGLHNVTTHTYYKSMIGDTRGRRGHCAANRTSGAILVPDPEIQNSERMYEEVLMIGRVEDERLLYKKQGVVWNFPAARRAKVEVELSVVGCGVNVALTDRHFNACDETVGDEAALLLPVSERTDGFALLVIDYDLDRGYARYTLGERTGELALRADAPHGLSYLHIQTLAEKEDFAGTLIRRMKKSEA